eukprot:1409533-Rhodomonas_salina.1
MQTKVAVTSREGRAEQEGESSVRVEVLFLLSATQPPLHLEQFCDAVVRSQVWVPQVLVFPLCFELQRETDGDDAAAAQPEKGREGVHDDACGEKARDEEGVEVRQFFLPARCRSGKFWQRICLV